MFYKLVNIIYLVIIETLHLFKFERGRFEGILQRITKKCSYFGAEIEFRKYDDCNFCIIEACVGKELENAVYLVRMFFADACFLMNNLILCVNAF